MAKQIDFGYDIIGVCGCCCSDVARGIMERNLTIVDVNVRVLSWLRILRHDPIDWAAGGHEACVTCARFAARTGRIRLLLWGVV